MTDPKENPRLQRLHNAVKTRMQSEITDILFRNPPAEPFARALEEALNPEIMGTDPDRPVVFTPCIQAPPELFHAAGVRMVRLACGSHAAGDAAPRHLPALTCPMVRSIAGLLALAPAGSDPNLVIPTTCDWVVKFHELICPDSAPLFLELPHVRESDTASRQWVNEIKRLKTHLEGITGRRITPKDLLASITLYNRAAAVFEELTAARAAQALSGTTFALAANALPHMDIRDWTAQASVLVRDHAPPRAPGPAVFLSGSPIVFPNFKLPSLIEAAGMHISGDDICTLERSVPGPAVHEDRSEYALIRALAHRHHQACTCPTFADNQRRFNTLCATLKQRGIGGVIFHVLKGCHPYDIEAGILENRLKDAGIRFLKIETDYVKEDEQNIVTRLEAFCQTLAPQHSTRRLS